MTSDQLLILNHLILHGLFFTLIAAGYIFVVMVTVSPRVWGYQDYPEAIKRKVPPQTKNERVLAGIIGLPWFLFALGFPVLSTYMLKTELAGEMPFVIAFLNIFVLLLLFDISDLVILDWLIISKITPRFVIIPGTEANDYKDFSHHYKGHVWGTIGLTVLSVVLAIIVSFL